METMKRNWEISQRFFINFPNVSNKKCGICEKYGYDKRDYKYLLVSKSCEQCDGCGYYHYDIDQHIYKHPMVSTNEEKFSDLKYSEKELVELLLYWEKSLIGFSYDCLEQCPCCRKYAIDKRTKERIRKRQACNLCEKKRKEGALLLQRVTSSGIL